MSNRFPAPRLMSAFGCTALLVASPRGAAQEAPPDLLLQLMSRPVITASKQLQSPSKAPAKVVSINAEEIRRRGYMDLEEVLHDLAGFDFEKGMGVHWSQIYMRGERSTNSDRFIFIWDGIIQNDIWAQVSWFERQYPLSNIARIEIMYGPASLLYGSNAMSGIINVILKHEGEVNGVHVSILKGAFNTRSLEVNAGRESGSWRFMANAKLLRSDERDLTAETWTDRGGRQRAYGLQFPGDFDLAALALNGGPDRAGTIHREYEPNDPANPAGGGRFWIQKNGYWTPFSGRFGRETKHWFVEAGAGYEGWNLRVMSWNKQGSEDAWTTPQSQLGASWDSGANAITLSHEEQISPAWTSKAYAIMRTTSVEPTSEEPSFTLDQGWDPTTISPLLPKITAFGPFIYYKLFNREYRLGEQLSYQSLDGTITGTVGLEGIGAKVYENYYTRITDLEPWAFRPQHEDRNLALYGNLQAEAGGGFSLAAGFRYDHNWEAAGSGGFGNLVSSRTAVIYTPDPYQVMKLVYGEAFQAPSPFEKYSVNSNRPLRSPDLKPERLHSLEFDYDLILNRNWKHSFAVYLNQVDNKILLLPIPELPGKNRFQNKGRLEIFGGEYESRYYLDRRNSVYMNLTANRARDLEAGRDTGGIAPLQGNLGADLLFLEHLGLSLRGHIVSARKTSQWDSPNLLTVGSVAPYATLDATLTWMDALPGLDVKLNVYNLTNARYYDPGPRSTDGAYYNGAILQQSFRTFLGITYRF